MSHRVSVLLQPCRCDTLRAVIRTPAILIAIAASLAVLAFSGLATARCRITNVVPLNFGTYDPSSPAPSDTAGEITIDCDKTTPLRVTLGRGRSGRSTPREMRYRNSRLEYDIYLDPSFSAIWGDGTGATQAFQSVAVAGRTLRIPMFARMPPRQSVPPGAYTDRVMVVVVF